MRIGVFDSGIGGLTVLKSLIKKHPNHQYFYFGDTINLPYGEKTKDQLYSFTSKIIDFLLSKKIDIIIIACGTVSSNIYDDIKNNYDVKIIDVINPAIGYIQNQSYKQVGIIGTHMTIKSKVFEKKLNIPVITVECPMFVPLIENSLVDTADFNKYINEYLSVFKTKNIEALVLGCTHYPLITSQINKYLSKDIKLIDLGEVIANTITIENEQKQVVELYFSKVDNNLINNVQNIIGDYIIIEKRL
jgi:glutamate racemase